MKRKKILINILLLVFFFLFLFSLYNIYLLLSNHHSNQKEVEKIQEEVIIKPSITPPSVIEEDSNQDSGESSSDLVLDFDRLNEINQDTVGWIEIRGTHINYPVVQTTDNDYYLNHSFYHASNGDGWVFLNYLNNSNFNDPNTIIFGHDTHGSSMFSDLKKLFDGLLGNYIPITIYLDHQTYHYQTFAVFLTDENDNHFLTTRLSQDDLDQAVSYSNIRFDYTPTSTDKILTLSTCYHSSKHKVILLASRID